MRSEKFSNVICLLAATRFYAALYQILFIYDVFISAIAFAAPKFYYSFRRIPKSFFDYEEMIKFHARQVKRMFSHRFVK